MRHFLAMRNPRLCLLALALWVPARPISYIREVPKRGATACLGFAMCNRNDPEEELSFALRTTEGAVCAEGVVAACAINRVAAIWIVTRLRYDPTLLGGVRLRDSVFGDFTKTSVRAFH